MTLIPALPPGTALGKYAGMSLRRRNKLRSRRRRSYRRELVHAAGCTYRGEPGSLDPPSCATIDALVFEPYYIRGEYQSACDMLGARTLPFGVPRSLRRLLGCKVVGRL